jgi:DNA-binding CsgD family transcriptional regulator
MRNEAWNKVTQTHDLFKKIIAPLKQHLGINFGYMIVFNDGSYYQIIEDLECLKKWVINVETSSIFCARNVTTYFDEPYNFTIWPEEATCPAMEIYKEYGMWNGITASKINKDYTELYWFTKQNAENGWHRWFIRNKPLLLEFIDYFGIYKETLYLTKNNIPRILFRFSQGFNVELLKSEYLKKELPTIKKYRALLGADSIIVNKLQPTITLSPREMEVLAIICRGYTAKTIAQKLHLSEKTVQHYIEHIKHKTNLHYKTELVQFYEAYISNNHLIKHFQ